MAAGAVPPAARAGRPGWRNADVSWTPTSAAARRIWRWTAAARAARRVRGAGDRVRSLRRQRELEDRAAARDARLPPPSPWRWTTCASPTPMPKARCSCNGTAARTRRRPTARGRLRQRRSARGRRFPGSIDAQGRADPRARRRALRATCRARHDRGTRQLPCAPRSPRGELEDVRFDVRGDLAGFPSSACTMASSASTATSRRRPRLRARHARRRRQPRAVQWPAFTQVAGEIVLDRGALEIRGARGRMGELVLHGVKAASATCTSSRRCRLMARSRSDDRLPALRRAIAGGRLAAQRTGRNDGHRQRRAGSRARHPAHGADADHGRRGSTLVPATTFAPVAGAPAARRRHARIAFTQSGSPSTRAVRARSGATPASTAARRPTAACASRRWARSTADGLRKAADEPVLARLASHVSGQSSYKLTIGIAKGQTEFALTSPLAGLGLSLPAPLNKPADAAWPLSVSTTLVARARPSARHAAGGALAAARAAAAGRGAARPLRRRAASAARRLCRGHPAAALQPGGIAAAARPGVRWRRLARRSGAGCPRAAPRPPRPRPARRARAGTTRWASSYVPAAAALKTPTCSSAAAI